MRFAHPEATTMGMAKTTDPDTVEAVEGESEEALLGCLSEEWARQLMRLTRRTSRKTGAENTRTLMTQDWLLAIRGRHAGLSTSDRLATEARRHMHHMVGRVAQWRHMAGKAMHPHHMVADSHHPTTDLLEDVAEVALAASLEWSRRS